MKKIKKLAALVFAVVLVIAMAVPAFATSTTPVNLDDPMANHTYMAYQIFSGTQKSGESKLADVEWGNAIKDDTTDNSVAFLLKLQDEYTTIFDNCTSASDVAEVISKNQSTWTYDSENARKFAHIANNFIISGNGLSVTPGAATIAPVGYYLICDETTDTSGTTATNLSLLQVTGNGVIEIKTKTDIPKVDKQVQDEVADKDSGADASGWGETADHDINEVYQYKLIATLPTNADMKEYIAYTVKFNDHFNEGVTFLGGITVNVYDKDDNLLGTVVEEDTTTSTKGYKVSATGWNPSATSISKAGEANWSLEIKDILDCGISGLTSSDLSGLKVVVTYDAKLNENAHVTTPGDDSQTTSSENINDVQLEYSNNPNWTYDSNGNKKPSDETGKTEKDYVCTFTYKMPNQKVDENNAPLENAAFKLYKKEGNVTYWAKMDNNNKITGWDTNKDNGTPVTSKKADASATKASFDIIGLDVGTYVLTETSTPAGYNTCKDIEVVIAANANHVETSTNYTVTETMTMKVLDNNSTATSVSEVKVVNNSGSVLPETGALGTKMIYIVGAIVMLGAAVVLISRRRVAR